MKSILIRLPRLLLGAGLICSLVAPAAAADSAITAPTQFVQAPGGHRLAYRSVGAGPALILCNRFRGTLDTWDPAFIDGLARHFRVITFDYRGTGRSTGRAPTAMLTMAEDARDVIVGLKLGKVVLGGWSIGGLAAQTLATVSPEHASHLLLIGTGPAGKEAEPIEPIFFERAHKPVNDLADEEILFFEPASEASRRAARASHDRIARRTQDLDVPMPPEVWPGLAQAAGEFREDIHGSREMLKRTHLPILILAGDHDIVFPVKSWHALNRAMPTAQLVVFPHSGHGPQHQFVEASVAYITAFFQTTR